MTRRGDALETAISAAREHLEPPGGGAEVGAGVGAATAGSAGAPLVGEPDLGFEALWSKAQATIPAFSDAGVSQAAADAISLAERDVAWRKGEPLPQPPVAEAAGSVGTAVSTAAVVGGCAAAVCGVVTTVWLSTGPSAVDASRVQVPAAADDTEDVHAEPVRVPSSPVAEVDAERGVESLVSSKQPEVVDSSRVVREKPVNGTSPAPVSLEELDRRARAAMAAGRLDRAYRLFRRIVARGGRGSLAHLAYGDLFVIARQLDRKSALRTLWRDYLKRFPRGRHAEDAWSGLCRSRERQRARCWTRYLKQFPDGAHVERARQELGR